MVPPSPASGRRRGSPARPRRVALLVALALAVQLALAWMQLTASGPPITHRPVIVRTGTPPTPFVTVSPHMESR